MEMREACIQQLRKTLERLDHSLEKAPVRNGVILDLCLQAKITLLHYEYYVDLNCREDQRIYLCKQKLEKANATIRAGKVQEGISCMRDAVESFLEKASLEMEFLPV